MVPTCTEDSLWFNQGSYNVQIGSLQDTKMVPTVFHFPLGLSLYWFLLSSYILNVRFNLDFPQYKSTVLLHGLYSNLTSLNFVQGFLDDGFGNRNVSVFSFTTFIESSVLACVYMKFARISLRFASYKLQAYKLMYLFSQGF